MALAAALALAAGKPLGKPLTLKRPTPLAEIVATPGKFAGKTVQVRGKVTEICEMTGCWMNLIDPAKQSIRVKVNEGDLVFPKTAVGKMATAEGTLVKMELTREQMTARARHEAAEQGRKFNPASVKSGGVVYQIAGVGAVVEE